MEVTLLGCGQMGRSAGYALATDPRTTGLTLVDRDLGRAHDLARWLTGHGGRRVRVAWEITDALPGRDAVAMAAPWAGTRAAIGAAARAGVPVASITRPPYEELAELDDMATSAGVPILLPIGLEPGLTELIAIDLAERLMRLAGQMTDLAIRCGGIPATPRGAWGYVAFFGGEQRLHLPIAQRTSFAVAAGRLVRLPRFSGVETFEVPGVGRLEAYHDGMVPWLAEHPALRAANCSQKTLRWPGFAAAVGYLADLGLLDEQPVDVDGTPVVPKRLVEHTLAPKLRAQAEDEDIVVLSVSATAGSDPGTVTLRSLLVDRFDRDTGLSAIARTTGFSLAAATALLAERSVRYAGWLRPHRTLNGPLFERFRTALDALGVRWSRPDDRVAPAVPDDYREGIAE